MTITRIQQVTAVLSGTSDTIVLPAAPQYGNTLIAIMARAGSVPIATSLTQSGATWTDGVSADNSGLIGHHIWYAQNVGSGASATITVTRGDSDDYVCTVIEYSGLRKTGTLLDTTATAAEDGNAPYTGQTAASTAEADELFLGAIAHVGGATRQETPNNDFIEIAQQRKSELVTAAVLGVYEKIVDTIDQPSLTVHTDEWVVWSTRLQTFFADVSTEVLRTADLSTYVVDVAQVSTNLEVLPAQTNSATVDLDLYFPTTVSTALHVMIGGTAKFADLDVSVDTASDRRAALDVSIVGTTQVSTDLDMLVGLGTFTRTARLDCNVEGPDERLHCGLDVAVLVPQPVSNVTTTPETSQYLACRPLWCNVPRPLTDVTAVLSVSVASRVALSSELDVSVRSETWFERRGVVPAWIDVNVTA